VCRSAAAAPIVLNLPQQKRPESNFIQLHREHSRPLVRDATCGRVPLQLRRLVSVHPPDVCPQSLRHTLEANLGHLSQSLSGYHVQFIRTGLSLDFPR
jgi:hypothetical protein